MKKTIAYAIGLILLFSLVYAIKQPPIPQQSGTKKYVEIYNYYYNITNIIGGNSTGNSLTQVWENDTRIVVNKTLIPNTNGTISLGFPDNYWNFIRGKNIVATDQLRGRFILADTMSANTNSNFEIYARENSVNYNVSIGESYTNYIVLGNKTKFKGLVGVGNAYVCVNANGEFYRSAIACV
jgi:hypothetical protein